MSQISRATAPSPSPSVLSTVPLSQGKTRNVSRSGTSKASASSTRAKPSSAEPSNVTSPARARSNWEDRSEEHTSELQSRSDLVCRLLLEKKKIHTYVLDQHI